MSHCLVCFDYGTEKNPLIKPCNHCGIQTHLKCIENVISTHLISQRFTLENTLIIPRSAYAVKFTEAGALILNSSLPICKIAISPTNRNATNYRRFFEIGGICSTPLRFDIKSSTVAYVDNYESNEKILQDSCPHCKNIIILKSKKNHLTGIMNLNLNSYSFLADLIETWNDVVKNIFWANNLTAALEGLVQTLCISASYAPWLYLFRNVMDFFKSDNSVESLFDGFTFNFLATKTTLTLPFYLPCLFYALASCFENTVSFFKTFILFSRGVHNALYCSTLNLVYLNLALQMFPDETKTLLRSFGIENINSMDYSSKLSVSFKFDFKTLLQPLWISQDTSKFCGILPAIQPSVFTDSEFFRPSLSMYAPFECFLYLFGGWLFGHKILGKYKPFMKFLYKILSRFTPTPVEIDLFLEYFGYQFMSLVVEVYDVIFLYYQVTSVTPAFMVLPKFYEEKDILELEDEMHNIF